MMPLVTEQQQPLDGGVQQSDTTFTPVEKPEVADSRKAVVRLWLDRIERAEDRWEPDFKRMRRCMDFAAGVQWPEQKSIDTTQYIANITNRSVAQKVSALYARDPKVATTVRRRLVFTLWDGKIESVAMAFQGVEQAMLTGAPVDPNAQALLNDYMNGTQLNEQLEKVAETLEVVYTWHMDQQEPEFKKQMKQLVRRVVTCGVGFVRLRIELPGGVAMSGDGVESTPVTRLQQASQLIREMLEDGATEDDARLEQVQTLLMGQSAGVDSAVQGISRLIFEFPQSTSVIVDPKCRQLKDFVGADWVAERYTRPKAEVEAFFEVNLSSEVPTSGGTTSSEKAAINRPTETAGREGGDESDDAEVVLYEVYDKRSKSRFIVCKGHDDFLESPEPVLPPTKRFWPWFTLTFNDVEVEPGCEGEVKSTIYPPSDVQLLMPMQLEWNRSREALREHRQTSVPFNLTSANLTDKDVERIKLATPGDTIKLEGLPSGADVSKVFVAYQPPTLNPLVYRTAEIQQDVLMTVGTQEANLGPTSGATATESTIAEQSRVSNLSSNTDDLDDLLTDLARAGGEMLMRVHSEDEVKQIAGPGALWPPAEQVDLFAQEIVLKVEAASSGRPNKALDVSNYERMVPWLLQAGANPKFLVEEGLKRLDERLPIGDAFPLVPQTPPMAPPTEPRGKPTTKQMLPAPGAANT